MTKSTSKISIDIQACFRYRNSYWFRVIDASKSWAAADAGTQLAIYDPSALENQLSNLYEHKGFDLCEWHLGPGIKIAPSHHLTDTDA